jgi:hypothetical protein
MVISAVQKWYYFLFPYFNFSLATKPAYLLKLPATWKGIYSVINEGWLSLYTAPMSPLQKQPSSPLAVIVEGEEEYKVVTIHGKKRSRNQDLYLVEWVGYPKKVDWTWEPQMNLMNAS